MSCKRRSLLLVIVQSEGHTNGHDTGQAACIVGTQLAVPHYRTLRQDFAVASVRLQHCSAQINRNANAMQLVSTALPTSRPPQPVMVQRCCNPFNIDAQQLPNHLSIVNVASCVHPCLSSDRSLLVAAGAAVQATSLEKR